MSEGDIIFLGWSIMVMFKVIIGSVILMAIWDVIKTYQFKKTYKNLYKHWEKTNYPECDEELEDEEY